MEQPSKIFEAQGDDKELKAVMASINAAVEGKPIPLVMASLIALLATASHIASQEEGSDPSAGPELVVGMFGSILGFDYSIHFSPSEQALDGKLVH